MLVKNSFEFDARVAREAGTLQSAGHQVTVVALRSSRTPNQEHVGGVEVVRVARPADELQRRVKARLGIVSTATPGDQPNSTARSGTRALLPRGRSGPASAVLSTVRQSLDAWLDRRLARVATATRPQVLHAHDLNTLKAAAMAADRVDARLVYDTHELATGRNLADEGARARSSSLERRLIGRADRIITASPGYTRRLGEIYGVDAATILNVPPLSRRPVSPAPLPRRRGAQLVVYVGSIQENRGLETAIRALRGAPRWDLAIVGYGHHRSALEKLVMSEGLTDRVHFVGPVPHDELVATVASADAGLCLIVGTSASYRLSVPNKLFEYFAAGLPVVAGDLPELAEIAKSAGAAVICESEDVAATAEALRDLEDDSFRLGLAQRARLAHETRYNWEQERDVLLTLYQTLSLRGSR